MISVRLDERSKLDAQRLGGLLRKAERTLAAPQRVIHARPVWRLHLYLSAALDRRSVRQERWNAPPPATVPHLDA
eukprot:1923123-Prymnesium_polylepis.1